MKILDGDHLTEENSPAGLAELLGRATVVFIFLFALAQPLSIAGAEIAFSAAAICWLTRVALLGRGLLRGSPLDGFILAYWSLCGLSAALAPLPASSWEGMRKIALIFLVLVVAHNVPNPRRTRQLLALLFLGGLISVAYAGWQLAAGVGLRVVACDPEGPIYQAGIRPGAVIVSFDGHTLRKPEQLLALMRETSAGAALRLKVVPNVLGTELIVDKDATAIILPARLTSLPPSFEMLGVTLATARPPRARGFYSHFITYSDEMQTLLALALGLWLAFRRVSRLPAVGFAVLALIFAVALGATLSRSAWLAATLGCLVQVGFYVRRPWVKVLLPIFLVLAAFGTNAAMRSWRGVGLIDPRDPSTQYRLLMWRDGLRLIRTHPWFGVGLNTIRDAWQQFDLAAYRVQGVRSHFHSTPIQFAVEMGIPVLLAWLALMAAYVRMLANLIWQAREKQDAMLYGLSLGLVGATCGLLANSLVQYNFGDSLVVMLFWFLMGLALATRNHLASE
jgi:O-antigen ligase